MKREKKRERAELLRTEGCEPRATSLSEDAIDQASHACPGDCRSRLKSCWNEADTLDWLSLLFFPKKGGSLHNKCSGRRRAPGSFWQCCPTPRPSLLQPHCRYVPTSPPDRTKRRARLLACGAALLSPDLAAASDRRRGTRSSPLPQRQTIRRNTRSGKYSEKPVRVSGRRCGRRSTTSGMWRTRQP